VITKKESQRMITISATERLNFVNLLKGKANLFAMTPEDYLRKIWYHEEASKVGAFVALNLLDNLLGLLSISEEYITQVEGEQGEAS
jgi:hypothetical protein